MPRPSPERCSEIIAPLAAYFGRYDKWSRSIIFSGRYALRQLSLPQDAETKQNQEAVVVVL